MISLLIGSHFGRLRVPVRFSGTDLPETREFVGALGVLFVSLLGRDKSKGARSEIFLKRQTHWRAGWNRKDAKGAKKTQR